MNNTPPHSKMSARAHRKGFSPKLPEDGWHEDRDGPWEDYAERCRELGAIVIKNDSEIRWLNDIGSRHRLNGPAVEYSDGLKAWWVNGKRHRIDGPAFDDPEGYKIWYVNNEHHRLDGPAVEHHDGTVAFYKDGIEYTDITFTQRVYYR